MGRYSTRALRRQRSHVRIVSGAPLYARARYRRPPGLLSRQPCFAKPRQGGPVGLVAKEQANRKKHGVDFRTAAKVFLDPYVIEFDDLDASGELRFNAIGLVDGRMLFVTYAMRGDVVRIISARGAEPHEKRKYHEI